MTPTPSGEPRAADAAIAVAVPVHVSGARNEARVAQPIDGCTRIAKNRARCVAEGLAGAKVHRNQLRVGRPDSRPHGDVSQTIAVRVPRRREILPKGLSVGSGRGRELSRSRHRQAVGSAVQHDGGARGFTAICRSTVGRQSLRHTHDRVRVAIPVDVACSAHRRAEATQARTSEHGRAIGETRGAAAVDIDRVLAGRANEQVAESVAVDVAGARDRGRIEHDRARCRQDRGGSKRRPTGATRVNEDSLGRRELVRITHRHVSEAVAVRIQ